MKTYLPNNNAQRPALPDSSEAEYVYYGPEQYGPEVEETKILDYWKILVRRRRLLIQIFVISLLYRYARIQGDRHAQDRAVNPDGDRSRTNRHEQYSRGRRSL